MERFDVLTVGDLCVDLVLSGGDVTPGFGQEEKTVGSYDLVMGGSTSIFACQASKLGLRVGMMGVVGDDAFGQLVLRELAASAVDTSMVRIDPTVKTGVSVHLQREGDRAILTHLGSIAAVEPSDLPSDLAARTRHLHIGSYFLLPQLHQWFPRVAREVRASGGTVSLDTNWDPEGQWGRALGELIHEVDVFFPNEAELAAIMGESTIRTALATASREVPITVVKQGSKGATAQAGTELVAVRAPRVDVVDTIGAGDSFDAGFLYGYLSGRSLEDSLAIACLCGTATVKKAGGTAGQLHGQDIADELDKCRAELGSSQAPA